MSEEIPFLSPQILHTYNLWRGGDFMERLAAGPRPVNPDLGEVNPSKAVVEDASNPPTHPLRRGGWLRHTTDPVLRGAEELAIATGRVEILNQPK